MRLYQHIRQVIADATATTTSPSVELKQAGKVSFAFKRSNDDAGSTAFKVQVSPDPKGVADASSTWIDYNRLISNVANTNAEMITRVGSVTISGNATEVYSMSPEDTYGKCRVVATETTDGTHNAWVIVQYYS
jgi:hypothetical protein